MSAHFLIINAKTISRAPDKIGNVNKSIPPVIKRNKSKKVENRHAIPKLC